MRAERGNAQSGNINIIRISDLETVRGVLMRALETCRKAECVGVFQVEGRFAVMVRNAKQEGVAEAVKACKYFVQVSLLLYHGMGKCIPALER